MMPEELRAIQHALGLTPRNGKMRRWSHRNYYCAAPCGKDAAMFDRMEAEGLIQTYRATTVTDGGA